MAGGFSGNLCVSTAAVFGSTFNCAWQHGHSIWSVPLAISAHHTPSATLGKPPSPQGERTMSEWIDISVALRTGMVHWPGDIPVAIEQTSSIERGDAANLSTMHMSAHTGTHMDAPRHFVQDGASIDAMPLEATNGPARVIAVAGEAITAECLEGNGIQPGERILFKTRNSALCWKYGRCFLKNYVAIDPSGARYLAQQRVRALGIDYLSIGPYGPEGAETHRILLGAGVWAIEGLDLSGVEAGSYELVCLPLKILNGDGAPARAMLRRLE